MRLPGRPGGHGLQGLVGGQPLAGPADHAAQGRACHRRPDLRERVECRDREVTVVGRDQARPSRRLHRADEVHHLRREVGPVDVGEVIGVVGEIRRPHADAHVGRQLVRPLELRMDDDGTTVVRGPDAQGVKGADGLVDGRVTVGMHEDLHATLMDLAGHGQEIFLARDRVAMPGMMSIGRALGVITREIGGTGLRRAVEDELDALQLEVPVIGAELQLGMLPQPVDGGKEGQGSQIDAQALAGRRTQQELQVGQLGRAFLGMGEPVARIAHLGGIQRSQLLCSRGLWQAHRGHEHGLFEEHARESAIGPLRHDAPFGHRRVLADVDRSQRGAVEHHAVQCEMHEHHLVARESRIELGTRDVPVLGQVGLAVLPDRDPAAFGQLALGDESTDGRQCARHVMHPGLGEVQAACALQGHGKVRMRVEEAGQHRGAVQVMVERIRARHVPRPRFVANVGDHAIADHHRPHGVGLVAVHRDDGPTVPQACRRAGLRQSRRQPPCRHRAYEGLNSATPGKCYCHACLLVGVVIGCTSDAHGLSARSTTGPQRVRVHGFSARRRPSRARAARLQSRAPRTARPPPAASWPRKAARRR